MQFSTSPAFTFTHTIKLQPQKIDPLFTPGPQRYFPKKIILHKPSASITKAKRYPNIRESVPGPGSYNIPNLFPKGCKYTIGKFSLRKKLDMTPGPSTYRPLKKSKSCFYSFGLKGKEPRPNVSPGPGKYNLRKNKDLIKSSYIFGKEKRLLSSATEYNRYTPGPGNYKFSKDAIKIRNPQYSFGKEDRKNSDKTLSPGPGAYNHKDYIGKEGQKITIPKSLKHLEDINDVGPGQYNHTDLNFYKPKSPSIKIGKRKRFSISKESLYTPGPGRYNTHIKYIPVLRKNEPRCRIGNAKRRPLIDIDKYIPGPAKYNIIKKTGEESPHYSMRLKTKIIKDSLNPPGVGSYHIEKSNVLRHNPTWKIGTEPKIKSLKYYKNTPGVGTYTINSNRNFKPKFGYTKQKREYLTINNYPGPGAYHIPCSFEELNTYTRINGKFNDEFRYI